MEPSTQNHFLQVFSQFQKASARITRSKGFFNENTDDLILHALIHAEVAEATEAVRKKKVSDKIPEFSGQEEELADVIIRIATMAEEKKLRVAEAILAKMKYNEGREYRHGGKSV